MTDLPCPHCSEVAEKIIGAVGRATVTWMIKKVTILCYYDLGTVRGYLPCPSCGLYVGIAECLLCGRDCHDYGDYTHCTGCNAYVGNAWK